MFCFSKYKKNYFEIKLMQIKTQKNRKKGSSIVICVLVLGCKYSEFVFFSL